MSVIPSLSAEVTGLFVGTVQDRWPGKAPSAIGKQPTADALRLEKDGFVGDNQADLKVHGGPEKAVHHYAAEHMEFWQYTFPDHADNFVPGAFGENVSTVGLTEANLCLGDILELGTATVQICQGRQPCWKLNAHTDNPSMAAAFQKSGRTGWYYRVLQTGVVQKGDAIRLVDRLHPNWTLARLIQARFDPKLAPEVAAGLAGIKSLSLSWMAAFEKKQSRSFTENADARLKG